MRGLSVRKTANNTADRRAATLVRARAWWAAAVKFAVKPLATAVVGTVPPFLLYVYLWEHAHLELVWPLYILIALSITLTTVLIWWEAAVSVNAPGPPGAPLDYEWPKVSALIAAYLPNEAETIFETLEAFRRIEYPGEKQIIVAYNTPKDMPDEERALERYCDEHPGFEVIRIMKSTSKAENVNVAIHLVEGELVGVFDADHQPAVDSFTRAARWMRSGEVDVVQGRCVVRNGGDSLMSMLVAVEFEQIYGVAHPGRAMMHGFGIFGGTNGFWRTKVLKKIGFDKSMLTEDIDSGMRALRAGHHVVSDPWLVSFELATTTLTAFWSQRMRWAQGWFQASIRHTVPSLREQNLSRRQRLGMMHLLFWRELYPWLALQMWPMIAFWVYRFGFWHIDWTVLPWVVMTFVNLMTGPGLVFLTWFRAHPSVRLNRQWFMLAVLYAPLYSEMKNGLCRVAQFKELRGGHHEWVVTPRQTRPVATSSVQPA